MNFLNLNHPICELLIAILIGGFLGLRREIAAQQSSKHVGFMGMRTMALLTTTGVISTFFDEGFLFPIIFFFSILSLILVAHIYGCFVEKKIGITSEISALLTFWIGFLIGKEEQILGIIIAIVLATINAFKKSLHGFAKTLTEKEWIGSLQLLALSGAILPFLPKEPIDPWGVLVPFNVWFLVILISGIGLLGYFLIKYFGANGGVPLMAFLGALVSSTAVTTSLSDQSKKIKLVDIFSCGIFIALGTMQVRVIIEILFLGTEDFLNLFLIIPFGMAITSFFIALYFFKKSLCAHFGILNFKPEVKIEHPFEIGPALKFGAIFVLVLFALSFGQRYLGNSGIYIAALFSGIIDVDAIVLSSLEAVKLNEMTVQVAQNSILISLFLNTVIKILYVAILGSKKLVMQITKGVTINFLVGILLFFIIIII